MNSETDRPDERRQNQELTKKVGKARSALSSRELPFLRLLFFYTVLLGAGIGLSELFPVVGTAWVMPTTTGSVAPSNPFAGSPNPVLEVAGWQRSLVTLLMTIGALAVSLPVAWVYTFTRRLRYDPSLVQSVIILPIVVSGIVAVVQSSVALAFSLAGIVAAVRFRNTLKDPKDAVHIFLALGIGIAAGVRALDIALVLSMMFNLVVLVMWKYNLAAMNSGDAELNLMAIGDGSLLIANNSRQREALRRRLTRDAKNSETDGILLVHTDDPETARRGIELSLAQAADKWEFLDNLRRRGGISTMAILLKLNKKADPLDLLGDLDERWASQINAAEYIPYSAPPSEKKADGGKKPDSEKPAAAEQPSLAEKAEDSK